ncbi:anthranilate phosphoribosyltransferase [Nigerium massiliense]|uniref:anthranilate phosphoribosyltransferase n=1 Tax=Nigerium massiliense TaxID=1522317 RepID=UPI00058C4494|nr:anthranilate phosphoribosyltransferase [Nigerium massiliense]
MSALTWPDVLTSILEGHDLDKASAEWAMNEVLSGNATPVQIAGFMVALRGKGETVEEISGLADAMLANALPIDLPTDAVDIVGSGGDRANTVNISTMAAIVAAAAGARIVKHGNRAASSACGTADVLEELGIVLDLPAERQREVFEATGIVFLFASHYHPSLRHAAVPRRELAISTTFNFLGPLANPARPDAQAVGVADARMAELMAGVLARRGNRGLVFHGTDGLDELTTTSSSDVWMLGQGRSLPTSLDPRDLGIARTDRASLVGAGPAHNAGVLRETYAGKVGPVRDIVLVNAAAALLAYDGPALDEPLVPQMQARLDRVAQAIDSGAAAALVDRWIALTQELAAR